MIDRGAPRTEAEQGLYTAIFAARAGVEPDLTTAHEAGLAAVLLGREILAKASGAEREVYTAIFAARAGAVSDMAAAHEDALTAVQLARETLAQATG